jgi:thymidylate synthase (FAD)
MVELVVPPSIDKYGAGTAWNDAVQAIYAAYEKMIAAGVPLEDARYILPEAITGSILMTMNARELYHFFKLRTAPDAQWEIRELAKQIFNILHDTWPNIFNLEILECAE